MRQIPADERMRRASRVTALARVLGAMLLVVFGWSVSLAFVSPCSVHDESGDASQRAASDSKRGDGCCPHRTAEAGPLAEAGSLAEAAAEAGKSADGAAADRHDGDDDGPCSCPVDCGSCCDGAGVVALSPDVLLAPTVFAELTEIPIVEHASSRAEREPRGIFHVPRGV